MRRRARSDSVPPPRFTEDLAVFTAATGAPASGAVAVHFNKLLLDRLVIADISSLPPAPRRVAAPRKAEVMFTEQVCCLPALLAQRAREPSWRGLHGPRCDSEWGIYPANPGSERTVARARSDAVGLHPFAPDRRRPSEQPGSAKEFDVPRGECGWGESSPR